MVAVVAPLEGGRGGGALACGEHSSRSIDYANSRENKDIGLKRPGIGIEIKSLLNRSRNPAEFGNQMKGVVMIYKLEGLFLSLLYCIFLLEEIFYF